MGYYKGSVRQSQKGTTVEPLGIIVPSYYKGTIIPSGSIVVPFWDYLIGFQI